MNSFVKQIVAMITGDSATETAIKIQRQAESALKVQISNREAETVNLETNIEDAKAAEAKAFVNNGQLMSSQEDRAAYVRNLTEARNRVIEAEEALEDHLKTLDFLKEKLKEVQESDMSQMSA